MSLKEQYWKYSLITLILLLGVVILMKLTPFMGGILGALTIYILVRNQMRFLTLKKKMRRSLAAILILMETILCFLIPLGLVVWMVAGKVRDINLDPQSLIIPIENFSTLIREKTGYDLLKTDNLMNLVSVLPQIGQAIMKGISSLVINIFVLIFVLYFMLIGSRGMEKYIDEMLPFNARNKKLVLKGMNSIVKSNAIGIPLLAIIQGSLATIGYYIFQAPSPLLFGLLTCFATVIPIVGTGLVWLPLALYMGLSGDWVHAAGLLIYSFLAVTQVDNLIRLALQKKMADTHPLITIFGVVIGLSLFGFMGIIFGPLLLSMFLLFVDIFKKEYLEQR